MDLNYEGKKFNLEVKLCRLKFLGLMFARREKARALLFDFKKSTNIAIHSWFVFFDFVAVWLDDKNKIIEIKVVKPFSFSVHPKKSFFKLIEIPVNKRYQPKLKFLLKGLHDSL